jgi:hypothetical protein
VINNNNNNNNKFSSVQFAGQLLAHRFNSTNAHHKDTNKTQSQHKYTKTKHLTYKTKTIWQQQENGNVNEVMERNT